MPASGFVLHTAYGQRIFRYVSAKNMKYVELGRSIEEESADQLGGQYTRVHGNYDEQKHDESIKQEIVIMLTVESENYPN